MVTKPLHVELAPTVMCWALKDSTISFSMTKPLHVLPYFTLKLSHILTSVVIPAPTSLIPKPTIISIALLVIIFSNLKNEPPLFDVHKQVIHLHVNKFK